MKLTKSIIGQLVFEGKSNSSADLRWDDDIKGFGIRVWPSGAKTFFLRYRFKGRPRYLALGAYGPLTLDQARKLAQVSKADIINGKDPTEERRRSHKRRSVADLCQDYLERHASRKRTCDDDRRKIDNYVLKEWGSRQASDISQADVQALHDKVTRTLGYPIAANRLLSLVSKMFNFALSFEGKDTNGVTYRYLDPASPNPARWIQRNPENKRQTFLRVEEIPKYMEAVAAEESVYIRAYFLLMPLLLLRKGSLLKAEWSWVDERTSTMHIPDSKSGQPIDVHLSPLALSILRSIPREVGNPYIFCGYRQGRHLVNVDDAWQEIRKRLGREELWIHDFRRLANWMLTSGVGGDTVSKVLSHSDPKVTQKHYAFVLGQKERDALDSHSELFVNPPQT